MKHLVTAILLTFILAYSTKGSANHDIPEKSWSVALKTFEKAVDSMKGKGHVALVRVVHHRHSLLPYRHVHTTHAMLNRIDARVTPALVKDENDLANSYSFYRSINLQLLFPYHNFW